MRPCSGHKTEHGATNSRMSLSMLGHQISFGTMSPRSDLPMWTNVPTATPGTVSQRGRMSPLQHLGPCPKGYECPHSNTWDRVPTGTNVPTATPGTVSQRGRMSPLQHLGPCPKGDECPHCNTWDRVPKGDECPHCQHLGPCPKGDECPHCNTWDRVPKETNVPTATPGTVSQRGRTDNEPPPPPTPPTGPGSNRKAF